MLFIRILSHVCSHKPRKLSATPHNQRFSTITPPSPEMIRPATEQTTIGLKVYRRPTLPGRQRGGTRQKLASTPTAKSVYDTAKTQDGAL